MIYEHITYYKPGENEAHKRVCPGEYEIQYQMPFINEKGKADERYMWAFFDANTGEEAMQKAKKHLIAYAKNKTRDQHRIVYSSYTFIDTMLRDTEAFAEACRYESVISSLSKHKEC